MSSSDVLLCSESEKIAILKKYERTTVTVQQDIENVRQWLEKQPHLPEIPDRKIIELFLLITKFRIEKTKRALDMYYSVPSLLPEFYDKDPNGLVIQKFMQAMSYIPLPKLTKELLRVVIVKVKSPQAEIDAVTSFAHIFNVTEVLIREDYSFGIVFIYDLTNVRIHHVAKFTPMVLKKAAFVLENVFCNGPKGIHFLNAPSFIDTFVKLLKTFLKPKIAGRIFAHKNMDSLYQLVPKPVLPKDYGGKEKSLAELEDDWRQVFLKYRPIFKHLREIKVDEKLRLGKALGSDLFGIEGNFRKLDLD